MSDGGRQSPTPRPQQTQNFHAISTSALQAGHWRIVRFCPQWGQKVSERPRGRTLPQKWQSHRTGPAAGVEVSAAEWLASMSGATAGIEDRVAAALPRVPIPASAG